MTKHTHIFWIGSLLAFASALALLIVWLFQWNGFAPCPLCLQQRYAYYIALPLATLVSFMSLKKHPPHSALALSGLLCVLGVIFLLNASFGAYHAGIEYGWWQAAGCTAAPLTILTTDDLLAALAKPPIACDQAAFTLFNISLAGYNALASFFLSMLAFYGWQKADASHE